MYSAYPWQQQEWQQLLNCKKNQKIPHAILIKGMMGVGKYHFALGIAEILLCQNSITEACGQCNSCQLLQSNTNPDLIVIRSENNNKIIKIDQIRELIYELNNTSQQGGYKVVIIDQAEFLNLAASNAILKTLEEPPSNVIIILTTNNQSALAPTVRSRCQNITIRTPAFSQAYDWLKKQSSDSNSNLSIALAIAENAPLRALDILQKEDLNKHNEFFQYLYALHNNKMSSVKIAEQYLSWDLKSLLLIFMLILTDIVKIKFNTQANIINQDQINELTKIALKTSLTDLFLYQKQLYQLHQALIKNINLNQQLAIENIIINWQQLFIK